VQAICEYVHDRVTFSYAHASPTKTAYEASFGPCTLAGFKVITDEVTSAV
jgi:hypothetical protein